MTLLRRAATALIVLGITVGTGGCDNLVAPSGSAISLIAATNLLPVNGATEITAIVLEGALSADQGGGTTITAGVGTPVHDGTLVTFTTTLGRVEPAQATTAGGVAKVMLIADGRSGTATVTAFSGAASQALTVDIGSAGAARIAVTASPQALPFTGGASTISARVEDPQGNGLMGVPVSFSTSAGSLSDTSVLTADGGVARTTLTTTAAATVTASAGGGSGDTAGALTGTVDITLKPRTTVTLTPPTTAVAVSTPATFQIGVGANTIVTDAVITFGDGASASLGAISSPTNVVHLFDEPGIFTVRVVATDSEGQQTSVSTQVAVGPLTAVGTVTTASPTAGVSVVFSVTVTPANAAIERYEWDFGDGGSVVTASPQQSHVYGAAGTKTVTVTVVPVRGASFDVLIQFTVS